VQGTPASRISGTVIDRRVAHIPGDGWPDRWRPGSCDSIGWLACGYHGWEFGADGRVMRVPQRSVDRQGVTNMRVPAYSAEARYGYVRVTLEEPLFDIPDFEEEAEGFRRIDEFYEVWNCAGLRMMEAGFDNAHTAPAQAAE